MFDFLKEVLDFLKEHPFIPRYAEKSCPPDQLDQGGGQVSTDLLPKEIQMSFPSKAFNLLLCSHHPGVFDQALKQEVGNSLQLEGAGYTCTCRQELNL